MWWILFCPRRLFQLWILNVWELDVWLYLLLFKGRQICYFCLKYKGQGVRRRLLCCNKSWKHERWLFLCVANSQAVFLSCCPDCPAHVNSIGWATLAIWAAIKKCSLIVMKSDVWILKGSNGKSLSNSASGSAFHLMTLSNETQIPQSVLTHTKAWGKLKWPRTIIRLAAHFTCGLTSALGYLQAMEWVWSYITMNVLAETRCH